MEIKAGNMEIDKNIDNCPVCGFKNLNFCFRGRDILYNMTSREYFIYKCNDCKAFFINPFPNQKETAAFYPKSYYSYNTEEDSGFFSNLKKKIIDSYFEPEKKVGLFTKLLVFLAKKKFSGIPLYKKAGGNFLDIGCGKGDNLRVLAKYGWNAFGLELDSDAVKYARKNGLNVQNLPLELVNYGLTKFDSIRIWHVFEHLTNPNVSLDKISNLLKDNGEILMAVPNGKSFARILFREYWYGLDVPRHVISYSPETLKYLLSKYNLVCKKIIYSSCGSFVGSISNFIRHKFGYKGNLINNIFLIFLFFPLDVFSDFLKRGDTIFLKIQKKNE